MQKPYSFTPYIWQCADKLIHLNRCFIMGVLNVTPDSFSDGGTHNGFDEAIAWAHKLLDEGADLIDIGGESTRPGSKEVSVEDELRRVIPVIKELAQVPHILLSIDTRHPQVAREAVDAGAHIINDISGFRDPEMVKVTKESNAGLIVMHMQGEPGNMQKNPQYRNVVAEVKDYLLTRAHELEDAGIAKERIMLDPGPGFGKSTPHDLEMQENFEVFAQMGYPVLEAPSRKRYLGDISSLTSPKDRDILTAAQCTLAVHKGAHMVRVHNVKASFEALLSLRRPPKKAYIALGANLGNAQEQLKQAKDRIAKLPLTALVTSSSMYSSKAAYFEDQDEFVNAVIEVESALHPLVLLNYLLRIEDELGRVRVRENGPRSIDLDLLAYEGEVHAGHRLSLPHPKAFERDFVLSPLKELLENSDADCTLEEIIGREPLAKTERYGLVSDKLGAL